MRVPDAAVDAALSMTDRSEGDEFLGTIVRYMRDGTEPTGRTETQRALLAALMPQLELSRKRAAAGRVGGSRPKGGCDFASKQIESKR